MSLSQTVQGEIRTSKASPYVTRCGVALVAVFKNGKVTVNRTDVRLTEYEHAFLLTLARGRGLIRTPRMLAAALYDGEPEVDLGIFKTFVYKIRAKLGEKHAHAEQAVRKVWGRGYSFGEPRVKPADSQDRFPDANGIWTPLRKEFVLEEVLSGRAAMDDIRKYYPDLSDDEFSEWQQLYRRYGQSGLRTTKLLEL